VGEQNGHTDVVVELLKHDKVDVNLQDNDGEQPLCWASRYGQTDVVVELLKHDKVDVNLQDKNGWTAFMLGEQRWPKPTLLLKC
jgi:ankyrin repeat protein